ncbi:MAG TPA: N-acetylmuramoyl-L-alanine amidase [Acidimicrobiales bacterium]|nr:N-acetylmuramoyl-L-alanine amidase [Acidimicrobiales bacterium]
MRLTWLANVLTAAGLEVVEHGDWRARGRDLNSVEGVVCHHTATSARSRDEAVVRLLINGRSALPGPLCQLGLDRRGRYHLIAAGKGNHNGHGLWGNQSIGIEAFNDGVGEPWPTVQVDAYVRGCAAICRKAGWPASKVLAHRETDPNRKVDPRGIDMDVFRARVDVALRPATPPAPRFDYPEKEVRTTALIEVPHVAYGVGKTKWNPGLGRDPIIVGAVVHGPSPDDGDGWWENSRGATVRVQPRGGNVVITTNGHLEGKPISVWVTVA